MAKADPLDRLAELSPDARALVLECLDEISRPLDRREIEKALGRLGITRGERMKLMPALAEIEMIALRPRDA
ncbi:MAG: hypothetical protein KUG65_10995 [Sphingomonadaceae bacterium]|nr:hypothetical protein [Sphingomonadaceae bacterium]